VQKYFSTHKGSAVCITKKDLATLKKMDSLAPQVMKAFWAFDQAAVARGAIPVKYKQLIAVAVALTTQCRYCIDIPSGTRAERVQLRQR
jgi:hypothetical protein